MGISSSKRKDRKDIKQNQNSNRNQFILGEKKNGAINDFKTKEKLKQNIIEEKSEIETLKIVLNDNLPKPKKWDKDKIWSFGYHKVFLGYLNAYFDHCPIKVSPNIIWQLILNRFSRYVNDYSEELRNILVNFEGKKDIECIRIGKFEEFINMKMI